MRNRVIDATKAPYYADKTGLTNAQPVIQAAINVAVSNDVIYLPSGNYRFDGPLQLKSGITVRGAGMTNTAIHYTASYGAAFGIGLATDYQWNKPDAPNNAIISGFSKGSSNLVFAIAPTVGALCMLRQSNDPTVPVISVRGYDRMQRQMTRIVAVSGNNVTIWPPLYWTMKTNLAPTFAFGQKTQFAGVEHLTIEARNSASHGALVNFQQAYACWLLNVRVNDVLNYGISLSDSLQCEVRGARVSRSQAGGSNRSGLLVGTCSGLLIEDNIFDEVFPNIELNSVSGSVFAYNFLDSTYWGGSFNANHTPHNHHNLYEGNMSANFQSDGYYGGASEETLFRNWFHSETPFSHTNATVQNVIWALNLNRFSRNYSVIGNVIGTPKTNLTFYGLISLGKPNMGNMNWTGYGPPWKLEFKNTVGHTYSQSGSNITFSAPFLGVTNVGWVMQDRIDGGLVVIGKYLSPTSAVSVNYTLGTRTNHTFVLAPDSSGWQELDTNVLTTTIFKGNHYFLTVAAKNPSLVWPTNQTPNSPVNADIIPSSLYLTSKPAWWDQNRWPAFGSDLTPVTGTIPAQARYYGELATPSDQTAPTTPISASSQAVGGTQIRLNWTASTDNVAVTWYFVERSQGVGSTIFSQVGTSSIPEFSDVGLLSGTVYNYRVRAGDAAGNLSGYSPVATASTPASISDPTAPSIPQSLVATETGTSSVNLGWQASSDNVGVTGYRVERSQGVDSTAFTQIGTPSDSSFTDTGLTASTVYNYRVRAADAAGNLSGYSSVATGTTSGSGVTDQTPPSAPPFPRAETAGTDAMYISWGPSSDNVGVTGYRVERSQGTGSTNFIQINTPTGTSCGDVGLSTGTVYNYRVRAVDAAGNVSGYSIVANGRTNEKPKPPAPKNVRLFPQ